MSSSPAVASARPRRRTLLVGCLLVALVVGLLVWWQRDDRPRADVGTQVALDDGSRVSGYANDVVLPFGRIRVTVGESREELPRPCCADEPADVRAPDDGSFVGIEVTSDDDSLRYPVQRPGTGLPEPELTLVVEGGELSTASRAEYPVDLGLDWEPDDPPVIPELVTYVAVEGAPTADDITVEVSFDGVTQRVEPDDGYVDDGLASQVDLQVSDSGEVDCGRVRLPAGFSLDYETPCGVTVQRTAYVGGLGWAPEGRTWLVVTETVGGYASVVRRGPGGPHEYRSPATDSETAPLLMIDGRQAKASWAVEGLGGRTVAGVFDSDRFQRRRLEVEATYRDLEADDTGPEDPAPVDRVSLTWQLQV